MKIEANYKIDNPGDYRDGGHSRVTKVELKKVRFLKTHH